MTELVLQNLVKKFDDVTAVDNFSLTIPTGGFVALLGYSGCGKTTTLRMIAGLEEPTSGEIFIDGQSILHLAPNHRNIGMIFQRYVLFPHMNVEKNVGFGLRMTGVHKDEIRERTKEALDTVQLAGYEKRFPSQLSGGQQQRVAIARTLITKPKLLLMDEPLSNLDAKLREEMRSFITELQKSLNITTLFVTHDQIEAIELADNIGLMFAGEMVQYGTPEEIFNHPNTPEIADFMGATNLMHGEIVDLTPDICKINIDGNLISVKTQPDATVGDKITMTIRPEHMEFFSVDDDGTPSANVIDGTIAEAVYHGGTVSYYIKSGNIDLQSRQRSTVTFDTESKIKIHLPPEHLWVFPGRDRQPATI
ncbi:MAG: spermidine/putrescine ABC transporter ATP-binding protein [Acidiferrobacteraceae bacterium]|nr:spermidine/putrescine ABC transporter ATP-binding protein [Acidiferrobacteraceae bacterium]